ncbi:hypothetical protein HK096_010857, partial [Nowakowskiella sp. JEL0078]
MLVQSGEIDSSLAFSQSSTTGFVQVVEAFDQWALRSNFQGLELHQSPQELIDRIKQWLSADSRILSIPPENVIVHWIVIIAQKHAAVKKWLANWETTPARLASQKLSAETAADLAKSLSDAPKLRKTTI